MTIKLIILDRDGVINFDSPDYIKSPDEWTAIPGSLEAIGRQADGGKGLDRGDGGRQPGPVLRGDVRAGAGP